MPVFVGGESVSVTEEMYWIADELRAVANLDLRFAENPYDKERYERILSASARLIAALERRSPDEVISGFKDNLSHLSPTRAPMPQCSATNASSSSEKNGFSRHVS